jgi:hypothetical protein
MCVLTLRDHTSCSQTITSLHRCCATLDVKTATLLSMSLQL